MGIISKHCNYVKPVKIGHNCLNGNGEDPFGNCRFPESGIAYGRFKKNWQYDVKVNDSTQLVFYHVLLVSGHVWWSKHVEFMTVEVELLWHVASNPVFTSLTYQITTLVAENLSVSNNII